MRLVIADTSPIRYLLQIGHIEILARLFERVSIPEEVAVELRDPSAPAEVSAWIANPPPWLSILRIEPSNDPELIALDPAERSAITLGISLNADLLLIDERKGSAVATRKGLETTGTLGVLGLAARTGLIDLEETIQRLKQTNFRFRQQILDRMLADWRERPKDADETRNDGR